MQFMAGIRQNVPTAWLISNGKEFLLMNNFIPEWNALHTWQSKEFHKISLKKKQPQTCSDYSDFLKWLTDDR